MKQEFSARTAALDDRLGVGRCFDMTARDLTIGGRRARLWVVNGYAQENILERMIAQWLSLPELTAIPTLDAFLSRCVTACDAAVCRSREEAVLGSDAAAEKRVQRGDGRQLRQRQPLGDHAL